MSESAKAFALKMGLVRGPLGHALYRLRFAGRDGIANRFVSPSTALCVEGFPRSANSYAYNAIAAVNFGLGPVARHLHTPSQLRMAARHGIPTLLLIREPLDTLRSLLQQFSPADSDRLLGAYVSYYRQAEPYLDAFVVSDFATTTTAFDRVLAALNARYSLALREDFTPDAEASVKSALADFGRAGKGVANLPPIRPDGAHRPNPTFDPARLNVARAAYEAALRRAVRC